VSIRKQTGTQGEKDVINLVRCPNCNKALMLLPPDYPLYDVQCTGCSFRAQVKTVQSKPKNRIFGAGWEVVNKVLKAGFIMPPLIINYIWSERNVPRRKILFYPFIPKTNLEHRPIKSGSRLNYKMFDYDGLLTLPHFNLYEE
jgi:DNA-directed RNA polymerase subunit RPC12/RpoP